jgi:hypothetical protein
MDCHILRRFAHRLFYVETVCTDWWKAEWDKLLVAKLEAEYCRQFYRRHRLRVSHVVAVQIGWTVTYIDVEEKDE